MIQYIKSHHASLLLVMILTFALPTQLFSQALTDDVNVLAQPATIDASDWLEPRGVNVIDLIGQVPEEHLRGAIVRYTLGVGLGYYESGSRNGNTVKIKLRYTSKFGNHIYCPGKPGEFDSWPSSVPASTMRIFDNGVDITKRASSTHTILPTGQIKPVMNTNHFYRYAETRLDTAFDTAGSVKVPANMGCIYTVDGALTGPLMAEFTFNFPRMIAVAVLGSQSLKFRSYIGVGAAGCLESLRGQMAGRFGARHDDMKLELPTGTEFFLLNYPTTPVDPYQQLNSCTTPPTAGSGTYRVRRSNTKLSVDHYSTMALPLFGQWQDADQSPGTTYLPHFNDSVWITSPEYFVPVGVGFDLCMVNGGCPDSLLNTINNAQMEMTAYYYSITRIRDGLEQIPLRSVGPSWSPGAVRSVEPLLASGGQQFDVFLPIIAKPEPLPDLPPDNPAAGCPCGWFDADGRMFDYVPGQ